MSLAGDAFDGALMRTRVAGHFGANVTYKLPFGSRVLRMPRPLVERLCTPAEICLMQRRDVLEFLREIKSFSLGPDDRRRMDQLLTLIEDALGFQLFEQIERAKRELSSAETTLLRFEYPGIDVSERVTRSELEEGSRAVTDAIVACLDRTVRASGLEPAEIDVVCLTGGTARMPAIARAIAERFEPGKLRELESLHSVIRGLAERARASLSGASAP